MVSNLQKLKAEDEDIPSCALHEDDGGSQWPLGPIGCKTTTLRARDDRVKPSFDSIQQRVTVMHMS